MRLLSTLVASNQDTCEVVLHNLIQALPMVPDLTYLIQILMTKRYWSWHVGSVRSWMMKHQAFRTSEEFRA